MTLIMTASVPFGNPPRVLLGVTASESVSAPLVVTRIHDDGTEWPLITEDAPQLISGNWVGYDYHAPFNRPIRYRAMGPGDAWVGNPTFAGGAFLTNLATNPAPASGNGWASNNGAIWAATYANGEISINRLTDDPDHPGIAASTPAVGWLQPFNPVLPAGVNYQRSLEVWADQAATVVRRWGPTGFAPRTLPANTWTRIVDQFPGSGVADYVMGLEVHIPGVSTGVHVKMRRAQLVENPGGAEVPYFDGSTPDVPGGLTYSWTGTPDASTSTATDHPGLSPVLHLASDRLWLVHSADAALSVTPSRVMDISDQNYESRSSQFEILGSAAVLNLVDIPRGLGEGTLEVSCDTVENLIAVRRLIADGLPILINTPWTDRDIGWLWVQPGTVSVRNPAGALQSYPNRRVQIPYTASRQPDLDLLPIWSDDDMRDTGWTADQVQTHFVDDRNLQLNIRSA